MVVLSNNCVVVCVVTILLLHTAAANQILRYEAEEAHLIGNAVINADIGYEEKVTCVDFNSEMNSATAIFTTNVVEDGWQLMKVRYATNNYASGKVGVFCNGHEQETLYVTPTLQSEVPAQYSDWYFADHKINLRQGLNTIVLSAVDISVDYIEVTGTIPLASRGATLPYYEIEAEAASHNGQVVGPDRTYKTLPSEASGRVAVSLTKGQYVEFTLSGPSNGWTLRFSIPDSADGSGNTASLGLYGGYPFSKRPSDGDPHHFYDEVRGMFNQTWPAGTKVRFTSTSDFTTTLDLADFYIVPAPYAKPTSGYVSITDTGADPDGKKDSTAAFQAAITSAQSSGKGVWIPQGKFLVNTRFTIDKLVVRGAGPWYSTVQATVPHGVGFFGNWAPNPSSNVQLYDFAIVGDTNDGPFSDLHITGVTIRNTYADGINLHNGISNVVIEQSIFRNVGDDALAMWSENNPDKNNVFKFNTIAIPILANGIAIYGGSDNSATDSVITDTICEGGGLQASNRFQAVPLAGTTSFARHTLVRTGAPSRDGNQHNGAIWFWAQQAVIDGAVKLSDIDIQDSSFAGGTFWGSVITGVSLSSVTITGAPFAFEVQGAGGKVLTDHVVASGITKGSIRMCGGLEFVAGPGNSGWNTTGICS